MSERPGPEPEVDAEEVLRKLATSYQPAFGTSDLAEYFDVSRQAMSRHLQRYEENGWIDKRKVGKVLIWWITDEGRKQLSDD